MSSTYNGNGNNPASVNPSPVAIASSTNASPIAITTATPHGYVTGDTVQVVGHQTNTTANGLWVIAVTGASTFTLTGSTGTAVGGATGVCFDYAVGPLVTLPADGDLADAASVNVPNESFADFMPWTNQRLGSLNLHAIYSANNFTAVGTTISSTSPVAATWTVATGLGTLLSAQDDRYLASGDVLELLLTATVAVPSAQEYAVAIGIAYNGGSFSPVQGTVVSSSNANASAMSVPVASSAVITSGYTANDRFDVAIMVNRPGVSGTIDLLTGYSVVVRHLRSNA